MSTDKKSVINPTDMVNTKDKNTYGFWVYLMTDCLIFAVLFATFAVLRNNTLGGPSGADLFDLPYILVETLLLLASSFACGIAMLYVYQQKMNKVIQWLTVTFVLGLSFLVMELVEFRHLVTEGNSWRRSGFLSSYFTLVGTHGLHITIGLLWMLFLVVFLYKRGFTRVSVRRLAMFSLFWHFLDIIWVFIFTIVYLFGVIKV